MENYDKTSLEILELRQKIENAVKRKIKSPADFEFLSTQIWEKLKEQISPTTLKRLWGYISGGDTPRHSTLDILSRFVDYEDWDSFLKSLQSENTSDFISSKKIESKNLSVGTQLEIAWKPNRYCLIEYLGENKYIVIESRNSKLQQGNEFSCLSFMLGHPLYIDNLVQGNNEPTSYVAGLKGGLVSLKLIVI